MGYFADRDRLRKRIAWGVIGASYAGLAALLIPASMGNKTTQGILDHVAFFANPIDKACAAAMQEYKATGKFITVPIDNSKRPGQASAVCSVGPAPTNG